jgi:hypothetical protein
MAVFTALSLFQNEHEAERQRLLLKQATPDGVFGDVCVRTTSRAGWPQRGQWVVYQAWGVIGVPRWLLSYLSGVLFERSL